MTNKNITTTGTGFFSWLGSLASRIQKLFVQDINFNGLINGTGNITTTGIINGTTIFSGNYNLTDSYLYVTNGTYYLNTNPYAFYNSTTLQNLSQLNNNLRFYNSTTLQNISQLANNNNYWNDTYATFNKTYADTLYAEIGEPLWTSNFTLYNNSWSSTYNATYDLWAYNQTTPAINTILGFNYYNLSSFDINDYYLKSNPYLYYNSTTLQNISQLNNNLGYYNTTTLTMSEIQNKGFYNTTQVDTNITNANTSMKNYVDALNITQANWVTSNFYNISNPYAYYNTTTLTMGVIQGKGFYNTTQVDTNITNANTSMKNYVDTNFYNKTTSDLRLDNNTIIRTWNTSWITNNVGNWSQDKINYYNKTQVDTNITNANVSLKNYVDALNISQANWVTSNFYSISNPYLYYNSTTLQNISQLNNNLGYYNTTTLTMSEIQNKGFYNTTQVDYNLTNYYVPYTGSNKNVVLGDYNFSIGTSDFFVNANTGNVGIGTTSPTGTLTINSSNALGSLRVYNTTGSEHLFVNGSTGNVGIGTTSPQNTLNVMGIGNFTDTIYASAPSTRYGLIVSSGKVGINTSFPNYALTVNGAIQTNQGLLYIDKNTGSSTITPSSLSIQSIGVDANDWDINNSWGVINFYNADKSGGGGKIHLQIGAIASDSSAGASDLIIKTNSPFNNNLTEKMRITYDGSVGIGTTSPGYPLVVSNNIGGISIYSGASISATGYITRTSIYNKSEGSALDKIQDASYYIKDNKIDHSKFYGYIKYNISELNLSKPIIKLVNVTKQDEEGKKIIETVKETTYPLINVTQEEGVLLDKEVDLLRQAIYELKIENQKLKTSLCKLGSSEWC
ncbi:hypothetical protein GYA25_00560 [Candidatus Woesearchaeota archaeon]|nr:hypothetical protein [Candidatus Woesearchaeota archaeon]